MLCVLAIPLTSLKPKDDTATAMLIFGCN